MKCPYCGFEESKVIDSRPTDDNERIRRRRECLNCSERFTTYEAIERIPIIVIKKDGSREPFSAEKLLRQMLIACGKRAVPTETIERAVFDIEATLQNSLQREVKSSQIGELALEKLRDIDEVAYVRFASVYKEFRDVDSFLAELQQLKREQK
ncbi:MAG: transcriptional repressor NrdR [Clostridia bacterium]|nr:transcriptional repressor NrdR [Clostridia bacterium]MBR5769634.1 transcriptional repressor NrdR [Clostridia bacterium]